MADTEMPISAERLAELRDFFAHFTGGRTTADDEVVHALGLELCDAVAALRTDAAAFNTLRAAAVNLRVPNDGGF